MTFKIMLLKFWVNNNDKEMKYDIRDWDSQHKKMRNGITLSV